MYRLTTELGKNAAKMHNIIGVIFNIRNIRLIYWQDSVMSAYIIKSSPKLFSLVPDQSADS